MQLDERIEAADNTERILWISIAGDGNRLALVGTVREADSTSHGSTEVLLQEAQSTTAQEEQPKSQNETASACEQLLWFHHGVVYDHKPKRGSWEALDTPHRVVEGGHEIGHSISLSSDGQVLTGGTLFSQEGCFSVTAKLLKCKEDVRSLCLSSYSIGLGQLRERLNLPLVSLWANGKEVAVGRIEGVNTELLYRYQLKNEIETDSLQEHDQKLEEKMARLVV